MPEMSDAEKQSFQKKVWMTIGIIALVVIVLWLLKAIFNVLLLLLAATLIALYFHGLSSLLQRKLHLSAKWSLPVGIITSFVLLGLFFWLASSKINQQVQQLSQTLPATIQTAKQQLSQSSIGQQLLQQVTSGNNMQKASATLKTFSLPSRVS